jgi:hypothetical protein
MTVLDCVEDCAAQTETVLRLALAKRVDRGSLELQMEAEHNGVGTYLPRAWRRLGRHPQWAWAGGPGSRMYKGTGKTNRALPAWESLGRAYGLGIGSPSAQALCVDYLSCRSCIQSAPPP